MQNCIFCKIISRAIPCLEVYQDQDVLAFLDIGPVSPGHTLVVPKKHYDTLDRCPPEVISDVIKPVGKIAAAVVAATGAEGYNVLCNNGPAAGQLVSHLHFHIIPRVKSDGLFPHWPAGIYQQNQAQQLAKAIKNRL